MDIEFVSNDIKCYWFYLLKQTSWWCLNFLSYNMPAFRQVGEKQLPNPVLCMAWSPKRDLIALANTAGEVSLTPPPHSIKKKKRKKRKIHSISYIYILTFYSCFYIAWLVSNVFGAYRPVSVLGRRSLHSPGDQMAKVRDNWEHIGNFNYSVNHYMETWECYVFAFNFSTGLQSRRHQAGCPLWCWESRDPSCVSDAESCNLHALDGGDGGEQVSTSLREQTELVF